MFIPQSTMSRYGFGTHFALFCSVAHIFALDLEQPSIISSSYVVWQQVHSQFTQSKTNTFFPGIDPPPAHAGESLVPINGQIVGGTEAARGQWPWMVKIFMDETYHCGGSLICPHWVLTAGHCVYNVKHFDLYIGAHDVSADVEDGRQIHSTNLRRLHLKYNNDILANDIGLIKLTKKVEKSAYINFIRLPRKSDVANMFVGVKTVASGWGLTNTNGATSDVLNFIENKIVITNEECSKNYGNIDPSILCIEGANNQSTCGGDSGGPLIYRELDDKWTQIGIVSFGRNESCGGFPQGFTRVTHYLGWISLKTGLKIIN